MALGANLLPIKKGEAAYIYQNRGTAGNINALASYNNIAHSPYGDHGFDEEVVRKTLQLNDADQLKPPESFREFEKFLCAKLKEPLQRYTYMRIVAIEQFERIFVEEFDAEVFLVVIDTFTKQVLENEAFNTPEEQE